MTRVSRRCVRRTGERHRYESAAAEYRTLVLEVLEPRHLLSTVSVWWSAREQSEPQPALCLPLVDTAVQDRYAALLPMLTIQAQSRAEVDATLVNTSADAAMDDGGTMVASPLGAPRILSADQLYTAGAVAEQFLIEHQSLLGLTNVTNEFQPNSVQGDNLGMTHLRYEQIHDGVTVFGSELLVHLEADGRVSSVNGNVVSHIEVDVTPVLTADAAAQVALDAFSSQFEDTIDTIGPAFVANASDEPGAHVNHVRLVVLNTAILEGATDSPSHLTWEVEVTSGEPVADEFYYVDAHDGEVVQQLTGMRYAYRKVYNCSLYRSDDPSVTGFCWSNKTYDGYRLGRIEGATPAGPNPYKNGSVEVDTLYDLLPEINDLYLERFGRNGLNWRGGVGDGTANADYDYLKGQTHTEEVYGSNCRSNEAAFVVTTAGFCSGAAVPDIIGHEYSHAILVYHHWGTDDYYYSMTYDSESGAIQEHFSDFAGEVFERSILGANDWIMGSTAPSGGYRNLQDPANHVPNFWEMEGNPKPDRYFSTEYYGGYLDRGGVHYNANVLNKGMYLASEGGLFNGYEVSGIGMEKAFATLYRAVTQYCAMTENFNGFYHSVVQSALDLYGEADAAEVRKAMQAVEIDHDRSAVPASVVIDRHLFYNDSAFDGNNELADAADNDAMARDKQALLPGQLATFANYSNYSRGINGVMLDVSHLVNYTTTLTSDDFEFRWSVDGVNWTAAPAPLSIDFDGQEIIYDIPATRSGRVKIIWADNAIENCWLEVRLKASANTGLPQDDVFYFGHSSGETGDVIGDTLVDSYDVAAVAANPHTSEDPAPVTDVYDFNRDTLVDAADQAIAAAHPTNPTTHLPLLDLRAAELPEITVSVAPAAVMEDGLANLAYTFTRSGDLSAEATVNFRVTGGAIFANDYTASGAATFEAKVGTVTFPAGSATAIVTIDPTADSTPEADETAWLVALPDANNAVGDLSHAAGTVVGDDTVQVSTVKVNNGAAQRSVVSEISVEFNTIVAIAADGFRITRRSDGIAVATVLTTSVSNGKTTAKLTFLPGSAVDTRLNGVHSLKDGNYQLTIDATKVTYNGLLLDGDRNGIAGDDFVFGTAALDKFFRYYGDLDGDRDVDATDYGRLGLTYRKVAGQSGFNTNLDFDGDGDVDATDYGRFSLRYRKVLPLS